MPDILITEFMDETAVRDLATDYSVLYDPDLAGRPDDLSRAVPEVRALIVRNRTQVRRPLIEAARHLVAVGRLGVGLDNIDVPACAERSIAVLPASGANDVSVAEYVIAGMLVMLRGVFGATAEVAAGRWPRERLIGREAAGRTLGLVGFGGIARAVAERAHALDLTVQAYDPFLAPTDPAWRRVGVAPVTLPELLATSDVVSLHVPLTDSTRNLLDAAAIGGMKRGAVLINTARGGTVDEPALADALRRGHLRGAMLDVFAEEPLGTNNPFVGIDTIWLTPHIAGVTVDSNRRVSAVTAENIRRALRAAAEGEGR